MEKSQTLLPKIVGAVLIVGIIAIAVYVLVINNQPQDSSSQISPVQSAPPSQAAERTTEDVNSTSDVAKKYVDGTYTVNVAYDVPQGYTNKLDVSVTLKDGEITVVNVENTHTDEESAFYDNIFQRDYKENVIGKSPDAVPQKISGASLTNAAFQSALNAIASQAR